jgi:hypothetical protein
MQDGKEDHKHKLEVIQVLNGYNVATNTPASVVTKQCTICGELSEEWHLDKWGGFKIDDKTE